MSSPTISNARALCARPRLIAAAASLAMTLAVSAPAAAETYTPEEDRARRTLEFVTSDFPILRLSAGLAFYPSVDDEIRIDLDAFLGGRFALYQRNSFRVELVPEIGYSYHGNIDAPVEGHYGVVALGLRLAGRWFGGATVSALLLGKRLDDFDLGVRNGLRLDAFEGILGLEVCHEWRTGDAGDVHSVRVLLTLALSARSIAAAKELGTTNDDPPAHPLSSSDRPAPRRWPPKE